MKLLKIKQINGKVRVRTGLHIGGGDASMEIGGMDNPIIKNPVNNEPYIPGSSLKGKMRSLLEWELDRLHSEGKVHKCLDNEKAMQCPICRVFGVSAGEKLNLGPTRLVVRDCPLSEEARARVQDGMPVVEEKNENSINRITAVANPRPLERVVPGVTFDLNISFKVLDMGDDGRTDEANYKEVVLKGLALVQEDFLGGGGSRGNGRVEFIELKDENGNAISLPSVLEAAEK